MNKNINYGLFFLLAAFWSGSFVAIKAVVLEVPPFFWRGASCRLRFNHVKSYFLLL